jgi:hypothetical protein
VVSAKVIFQREGSVNTDLSPEEKAALEKLWAAMIPRGRIPIVAVLIADSDTLGVMVLQHQTTSKGMLEAVRASIDGQINGFQATDGVKA